MATITIKKVHPRAIQALEILCDLHDIDHEIIADEWDEPREMYVARNSQPLQDDIKSCGLMAFVSFDTPE